MANIIEDEVIRAELQDGARQVDENLVIDDFESVFERGTRTLRTYCKAVNKETGETVELNNIWG